MNLNRRLLGFLATWMFVAGCAANVETADGAAATDDGDEPGSAPPANSFAAPWPMLGQGPTHQSRSRAKEPGSTHRVWDLALGEPVWGSCVIGAGGVIYAGTESALHAVDRDGTLLWSVPIELPAQEPPSPAIGIDGTIYIRNGLGIDAYSPKGERLWRVPFEVSPLSSPTVGTNGTIHVSLSAGALMLLDPTGAVLRSLSPTGDGRYSTPAIDDFGRAFFMQVDTFSSEAWAFDSEGKLGFAVSYIGPIYGYQAYPVEGLDGSKYLSTDGALLALASDGKLAWQLERPSNNFGPAIGSDGTIYWASGAPLTALSPEGEIKWTLSEAIGADDSVAIAADGTIYASGEGLVAVDTSGAVIDVITLQHRVSSRLAIDDDGTVLFGTADGAVHAR